MKETEKEKFQDVCKFYATTHRLKNLERSGWLQWSIKTSRVESVAEHIYGTIMLAFALESKFDFGVNLEKVLLMLDFHELGECVIGDLTILDGISKETKDKEEVQAVSNILKSMNGGGGEWLFDLFCEFVEGKSKEAQFAHMVDKMESDLQMKFYEETGCNDLSVSRQGVDEKTRQKYIAKGCKTLAEVWLSYHKENCSYDERFKRLVDFVLQNDIFKK